ncbi:MAG: helix-turn-helix domain-containing protein [Polyangiaceae bacterium]|nr:helix-turn-helix domain-containing protein [Polyangiaceae bacterium]
MSDRTPNRVRERRELRGLSQTTLAERARLSRQSVGAIEAGRAVPAVDVALRVASALDCSVEDLFADTGEAPIRTEASRATITGRVAMAQVAGRWVSYPLDGIGTRTSADGLAVGQREGPLEIEPLRPLADARENVVIMGCALGLGLVADRLNSRPGPGRFLWLSRSSTAALEALASAHTHVAGVHLVDKRTGAANVEDVARHTAGTDVVLITLARWEAGLVTAPGNPKGVKRASDLARRGLRLVTREEGSGARRLFDQQLREAGAARVAHSMSIEAAGHLEVAQAVAMGAGDVGVATRDAALACGLDFIPLAEERYDLVVPLASMEDVRIARLLDVMTSGATRRELTSLGYDVRSCGDRVAQLPAA